MTTSSSMPWRVISKTVDTVTTNAFNRILDGVQSDCHQERANELREFCDAPDLLRRISESYMSDQLASRLRTRSNERVTVTHGQGHPTGIFSDVSPLPITESSQTEDAVIELTKCELNFLQEYDTAVDEIRKGIARKTNTDNQVESLTATEDLVKPGTLLDALVSISNTTSVPAAWDMLREALNHSEKVTKLLTGVDLMESVGRLKETLGIVMNPQTGLPQELLDVFSEGQEPLPSGWCGTCGQ